MAEARRQKAHEAIHDYFTLVSENKLLGKPGLQELRKDLLETALRYYQDFLAEWGEDPAMRAEVAATLVRVAAIQDQLGQTAAARTAYVDGLSAYEKLAKAAPGDTGIKAARARAYGAYGGLLSRTGSLEDALAALHQARAFQEELAGSDATDPDRKNELARTYLEIGVVMDRRDRRDEARVELEKARDLWSGLVATRPARPEFRAALASAYNALASAYNALGNLALAPGDWDGAIRELKPARDLLEELVRQHPSESEYQAELAGSYQRMANAYYWLGQIDDAVTASRRVRDNYERLVHDNPAVTDFLFRLALAYAYLGKDLGQRSETMKEALATCDQAFPLFEKLLRIVPGHPEYRQRLGDLYIDRGHYLSKPD